MSFESNVIPYVLAVSNVRCLYPVAECDSNKRGVLRPEKVDRMGVAAVDVCCGARVRSLALSSIV